MRVSIKRDVVDALSVRFDNRHDLNQYVNECLRLFVVNGIVLDETHHPVLPVTSRQLDRRCDELAKSLDWLQNEIGTLQHNHNFLCTLFFEHLQQQLGKDRFNEIIDRANERLRSGDDKTRAAAE